MQPSLTSSRLRLRPYVLDDVQEVRRLAGDRQVAEPTAAIPHPYPEGAAEAWIASHPDTFATGRGVSYAVTLSSTSQLVGTVSLLDISFMHSRAEVGYWVGLEFWGKGYCSEALARLLEFGESHFKVTRFVGRCMASNKGSARVLEKTGFVHEGSQVSHILHHGRYEDMLLYGKCAASRSDA